MNMLIQKLHQTKKKRRTNQVDVHDWEWKHSIPLTRMETKTPPHQVMKLLRGEEQAGNLPRCRRRDNESFSTWFAKYEMTILELNEQSKKTTYDCWEIALDEEPYSFWKNWVQENPDKRTQELEDFLEMGGRSLEWKGQTATRINKKDKRTQELEDF